MKRITVSLEELTNDNGSGGLEIIIPGSIGDTQSYEDTPIFIEYYEGKLRVITWDLEDEPTIITLDNISELLKIKSLPLKDMPQYINHENEVIREVVIERLKEGK